MFLTEVRRCVPRRSAVSLDSGGDWSVLPSAQVKPSPSGQETSQGLHPVFKRLMLILMVAGPFFWLVFTKDGQRRADLLLLSLSGDPEIDLALDRVNLRFGEAAFRHQFPGLEFHC